MKHIFKAKVIEGKLHIEDKHKFHLHVWSLNGKDVDVTVGKPEKKRTNAQSRYYWGVVIEILSNETGYTKDEMHDALRMLFLRDNTKKIPTIRSTTSLDTVSFEKYMSEIRIWSSAELSCYLPEPNEVEY